MMGDRLAYAVRWSVVAVYALVLHAVAVGNERFLSRGDRPDARQGKQKMVVNGRVADNTLQQFVCLSVVVAH